MTHPNVHRREFLRAMAVTGSAVAVGGLTAACADPVAPTVPGADVSTRTINVRSIAALQAAINSAAAGDEIVVADGTYANNTLNVPTSGIVVRAATPGGVFLHGTNAITISANRVVFSGFQFTSGSIAGVVIISIAALWAPYIERFDSIVKYFQQLMSYLCPPVVAVFLSGLFWSRTSATGAFCGLLSGFFIGVGLLAGIDHTPLAGWNFLYVAPLIFLVSLGVVVGVSLVSAPPSPSVVDRFVWRPAFYREESAELAAVPWFRNYRVLSVLLLAAALVFIIIWR